MRKTEAPYKLRIVFGRSEEEGIEGFMRSWNWKCQHLAASFTHVTAKLHDGNSPTSHLQQSFA